MFHVHNAGYGDMEHWCWWTNIAWHIRINLLAIVKPQAKRKHHLCRGQCLLQSRMKLVSLDDYFLRLGYDICVIYIMVTSSNGNIFCVTRHLCGNSPVTGEFPPQRPLTRSFDVFFFIYAWINGWVNNGEAGDWRRHRAHYEFSNYDITPIAIRNQLWWNFSFLPISHNNIQFKAIFCLNRRLTGRQ